MAPPIRVLIVEDHKLVAEGLELLLQTAPDLEVAAILGSAREAAEVTAGVEFDIALVDFRLPDGSGAEAARALRAVRPPAAVVFLSADESEESLLAAVEAGASGYLLKSGPASEVLSALRRAAAGEMLIPSQKLAALLLRQRERDRLARERERAERERGQLLGELTEREREVLELIAAGLDNRSIAGRLSIGTGTVRAHVQHVLEKLGVHSKLQAAAWAAERGLLARG